MNATPNFNRVARLYRWAEYLTLGPLLQRTRTHFLPRLTKCQKALVLGDGDGRFLTQLLRQKPLLHAIAVDTSTTMLYLLRKRCRHANTRLCTEHADALTFTPACDTDLIVTHFFLDCFTQPEVDQLARNLASSTRPGTLWLLSDFRIPTGPLHLIARIYVRALYLVFRILTNLRVTRLPDPQTALTAAGFTRVARYQTLAGILYTELWQLGQATIGSKASMSDIDTSRPAPHLAADALPDPEPAAPSLSGPDPGIFHHHEEAASTNDPRSSGPDGGIFHHHEQAALSPATPPGKK